MQDNNNPYLSIASDLAQREESDVRETMFSVKGINPDIAARAQPFADKHKVPLDYAIENINEYEQQAAFEANPYLKIAKEYPSLSKFLKEHPNAAMAHDDLSLLESVIKTARDVPAAFKQGQNQLATAETGYRQMFGQASPEEISRADLLESQMRGDLGTGGFISGIFTSTAETLPMTGQIIAEGAGQGAATGLGFAGVTLLAGQTPPLIAAPEEIITVPIAGTMGYTVGSRSGSMYATFRIEAGAAYREFIGMEDESGNGLDPDLARGAAIVSGGINSGLELFALQSILRTIPGGEKILGSLGRGSVREALKIPGVRSALTEVGKRYATGITNETATEIIQEATNIFAGEIAKASSGQDFEGASWDEISSRLFEAGEKGLQASIGLGAPGSAYSAGKAIKDGNTLTPEQTKQYFKNVGDAVKKDKLFQRNREKFKEAIAGDIGDGSVHINAEGIQTLYQSMTPEDQERINAAMPDLQEKINESIESGSDVIIDRADYISHIQPEYGESLADYVKLSEEDQTAYEQAQEREFMEQMLREQAEQYQQQEPSGGLAQLEKKIYEQVLAATNSVYEAQQYTKFQMEAIRSQVEKMADNQAAIESWLRIFENHSYQKHSDLTKYTKDNTDQFINDARKRMQKRRKEDAKPQEKDLLGDTKKKKKGKAAPTPVISWLGKLGGIDPDNAIAGDLAAMDVTSKSHKRLFKRGSGLRFDAIPVSEARDALGGIEPKSEDGVYVDPAWLLEQIRNESFGEGELTDEQRAADDRARYMDELEAILDAEGIDLETATNAEIKEAIDRAVADEGGDVLYQSNFTSGIEQAVLNIQQEKGTGEQFLSMIQKAPGVKQEEIEWIGLDEFLKEKKSVTKQEVLDYIEQNKVRVEEVVLGVESPDTVFKEGFETQEDLYEAIRDDDMLVNDDGELKDRMEMRQMPDGTWNVIDGAKEAETKFSQYTLPGGENYREVLLTLPTGIDRANIIAAEMRELSTKQDPESQSRWQELSKKRDGLVKGDQPFKSSHYDQPNILAHVRLNDRTTADGKRVLFVEEIQSDWHQAGRKKGYITEKQKAEYKSLQSRSDQIDDRLQMIRSYLWEMRDESDEKRKPLNDERKQLEEENKQVIKRLNEIMPNGSVGLVPDAPLKKTWHEMALRRVIQMAAEGGYDAVAWTPGEVQNDRYDLSKHIGRVVYNPTSRQLFAYDKNDPSDAVIKETGVTKDKLADYLGKDVSERLLNDDNALKTTEGAVLKYEMRGQDLKVGGEGMKGFYDNILVKYANKFGKKFGAKVGVGRVVTLPGLVEFNPDEAYSEIWQLPITDEMRESVSQGVALFQQNRGQFQTFPDGRTAITLFRGRNKSTLLHEAAHFFSYAMQEMARLHPETHFGKLNADTQQWWLDNSKKILNEAKRGNFFSVKKDEGSGRWAVYGLYGRPVGTFKTRKEADAEIKSLKKDLKDQIAGLGDEDYARVAQVGAVTDAEAAVRIVMEEQFARAFEVYLYEGKAPSLALRDVFRNFKAWLFGVYKKFLAETNYGVGMDDNIRSVFDRLLATDEQIEEIRKLEMFQPDPETMLVLNASEQEKYLKSAEKAVDRAKEKLLADAMKEEQKRATEEYKAEWQRLYDENMDLLKNSRVYTAYDAMQQEGADADTVAMMAGYQSTEDMLADFENLEPMDKRARRIADNEMNDRYGDMLNDGTIERAAVEYMVEATAGFEKSQAELRAAAEKAGIREPSDEVIKSRAAMLHKGKKLRDATQMTKYFRAAVKHARLYGQMAKAGKWKEAANHKYQQKLNQRLYMMARETENNINKSFKRWKTVNESDRVLAERNYRDVDFVKAARAVLSRYGIAKSQDDFVVWMARLKDSNPDLAGDIQAAIHASSIQAKPWKDLTVEEFSILQNGVDELLKLARENKEYEIEGKKLDKAAIIGELSEQIDKLPKYNKPDGMSRKITDEEKSLMDWLSTPALVRRVGSWARSMDLGEKGAFTTYIYKPVIDAIGEYHKARKPVIQEVVDILSKEKDRLHGGVIEAPELGYTFENLGEVVGMLLHVGNNSNKEKLVMGRGWGKKVDGEVDYSKLQAFLDRAFAEGIIKKQDMELVQSLWNLAEKLKPDAQRAHKKMFGFFFQEITAEPVVTPFGVFDGGYWPAVYDHNLSSDQQRKLDRDAVLNGGNTFMFPQSSKGFTFERSSYYAPLELSLRTIPAHIDKVLRFTHINPAVRQTAKIVNDKTFRAALDDVAPDYASSLLIPWLQRAAQQSVEKPADNRAMRKINDVARALRINVAAQTMYGNITNALQQITGFSPAMKYLGKGGGRRLARQYVAYWKDPKGSLESMYASSERMRNRIAVIDRILATELESLIKPRTKKQKVADVAHEHGYFAQVAMEKTMIPVIWHAQYEKSIEGGASHDDAVFAADEAVIQTQGSFNPEDLSNIEAQQAIGKLFMMWYGWFNTQGNLLATEWQIAKRTKDGTQRYASYLYTYLMVWGIPALAAEMISAGLRGDLPEDDDEDGYIIDDWLMFVGMSQARFGTAMIPVVGQGVQVFINKFDDKWYNDRITTSPIVSAIEKVINTPFTVSKAITDEGDVSRAVRDGLYSIGIALGLPLGQLGKPAGYIADVAEGDDSPENILDITRGLAGGAKPEK